MQDAKKNNMNEFESNKHVQSIPPIEAFSITEGFKLVTAILAA